MMTEQTEACVLSVNLPMTVLVTPNEREIGNESRIAQTDAWVGMS